MSFADDIDALVFHQPPSSLQLRTKKHKQVRTGKVAEQINPSDKSVLCRWHQADDALVKEAIEGALKAKVTWEAMPWADR